MMGDTASSTSGEQPTEGSAAPAPDEDLSVIAPAPSDPIKIGANHPDGPVEIRVNRLRTREFLALTRAASVGLGPALGDLLDQFDTENPEDMQGPLIAALLMGLPRAGDDLLEFVQIVCVPAYSTKDDKMRQRFVEEMTNPDPEDFMSIIERVILQEIHDIAGLVGKARAMAKTIGAAYQRNKKRG